MLGIALEARDFWLRRVRSSDTEPFFYLANIGSPSWSRLTAEGTLTPRQFQERLWRDVLTQYLVCDRIDGAPRALAAVYRADLLSRTSHIDVVSFEVRGAPADAPPPEFVAEVLLIEHAFRDWDMRKVYFEYIANGPEPLAGLELAIEEARFVGDYRHDGTYWDRVVTSVWKCGWQEARSAALNLIGFYE